jgi:hypothetical protein
VRYLVTSCADISVAGVDPSVNFQAELQEFKRRCKINLALRDEALAKVGEEQKALEQVQTNLQVVSAALGGAALPPQIEATTSKLE